MNLQNLRHKLERKKGSRDQIQRDLETATSKRQEAETEIRHTTSAQAIIQAVAIATQKELRYRIEEPVSLALGAVYQNPYKMVADFIFTGRGTTECHLGFERDGVIITPVDNHGGSSGGGPIDIASFALRIGSWSLAIPRSRPILITDEPFRWIDKEKGKGADITTMHLAGQFLKEVTKPPPQGLGLQIICISHIRELIDSADKVFTVTMNNKVSSIE